MVSLMEMNLSQCTQLCVCVSMCVCVFVYRSGQLIEPLYQVWEDLADTELLPTKTGQQVR